MPKTLLVLGNGFDLAHGLPTRYSDFLEFSRCLLAVYTSSDNKVDEFKKRVVDRWEDGSDNFKDGIDSLKSCIKDLFIAKKVRLNYYSDEKQKKKVLVTIEERIDKFNEYLENNIWYKYIWDLYDKEKMRGENWIDFESEISYVIEAIDRAHTSLRETFGDVDKRLDYDEDKNMFGIPGKLTLFGMKCRDCFKKAQVIASDKELDSVSIYRLREALFNDLEKLTWAFEIYLTDFVEKIKIPRTIPEIENIHPDFVVCFNYTKTYEKEYVKDDSVDLRNLFNPQQICHIHGTCEEDRDVDHNNMVLGIDEYLPENKRTNCTDFAIFKKFVQRIRKRNDVSYASWHKEIEEYVDQKVTAIEGDGTSADSPTRYHDTVGGITDVYIYGHSLDITDKDILQRFLAPDHTRIKIYAYSKADEGELISNLIKVIGEERVIEKSTSNPPLVEFWEVAR